MNDQNPLDKKDTSTWQASADATVLTRQATPDELKLIELNRALLESHLRYKTGWKFILICSSLFVGLSYGLYVTKINEGFGWFLFFWVSLVVMVIGMANSDRQQKRRASRVLKDIALFHKPCYVEVQIYQCTRALCIPDDEGMEGIHLLEIGENQLLCWHEDSYEELGVLPVTEFEVYVNKKEADIFNRRFLVTGKRFQALSMSTELSWDARENLPEHGTIIPGTVDSFLEQLTKQYKSR